MFWRFKRTKQLIVLAVSLAVAFVATAMAAALDRRDDRPPKTVPVLEAPTGPVVAPQLGPRHTSPAAIPAQGGFASVQVNVDEAGQNILNDAANEPSIAVDPTAPNRIVIGWRQFDTVNNSFRQAGWGYSNDGGRSWTFPGVLEPGVFRSDPVLDFDAEGNFYYNSLRGDFSCWIFKSTDGGVNWSVPVPAFGGDKQWMTIDRTGGIGHGNIYQAWSTAAGCCGLDVFNRSTNGGASFEVPIAFATPPIWGTLTVGPDGQLYVAGVSGDPFDPGTFLIVRSSNAQDADETPVFDMMTVVDMGGSLVFGGDPNPGGLSGQTWLTVDRAGGPNHGNLYMLCAVNPPGSDPLDIMFARSTDGGEVWSDPIRVNDDQQPNGAYQWFGTMSIAPNGRIDVIWNDTRNTGVANMSELFYSFSTDGGVTWSANTQLSPVFDSWIGWPQQNKIGDYYDMISDDVGAHLAWAATFNGEQDVYYLRIGDYDCNSNGIPDNDDLDSGESADCNLNGIPDECEIAAGTVKDADGDGVPDECDGCPWDLDDNGSVGASDLLSLLASWGPCEDCPADFDGDGNVGAADLLALLVNWGPCP
ncbi:MAG: sialidase family protein [Phycisphaerales bacterium]